MFNLLHELIHFEYQSLIANIPPMAKRSDKQNFGEEIYVTRRTLEEIESHYKSGSLKKGKYNELKGLWQDYLKQYEEKYEKAAGKKYP